MNSADDDPEPTDDRRTEPPESESQTAAIRMDGPPESREWSGWWLGVAIVLVAALGTGVWYAVLRERRDETRTVPTEVVRRLMRPEPAAEGFVGSDACRECHAKISERYAGHPMSQSMCAIESTPAVEDYQNHVRFAPTARREYWIEREGDRVNHHEIGKDDAGQVVFDQSVPIAFVMGSGQRGRAYLLRRDQFLYMSPISWYSAKKRWDLSPGYGPDSHRRFDRPASDRCLQCHVGRVNYAAPPSTDVALRYGDPTFSELSIGCERCHGPGRLHIAFRRQASSDPAADASQPDPIVNPSRLSPARRDAVCNQCHLQGEAQILRYGRLHGDFRPGDLLGDVWTIFVRGTRIDDALETKAVSQVEQLAASRCFQQSAGKLGCISCHDPHEIPNADSKPDYYEAKCLQCHQPDGCRLPAAQRKSDPQRRDCITCHMPRLAAADIPHTSQTDHRLLRDPEQVRDTPTGSDSEGAVRIFDLADCPLNESELDRAWGIWLARGLVPNGAKDDTEKAQRRLTAARQAAPDDVSLLDELAITYANEGRTDEAIGIWRSALAIEPQRQNALSTLAFMLQRAGDQRQAAVYLDQLIRVNPFQSEVHLQKSRVMRALDKLPEAIESAEQSRELDPSRLETYVWLKELYQLQGTDDRANEIDRQIKQLRGPDTKPDQR